jgi:pilus assembly protein Flp/PilA
MLNGLERACERTDTTNGGNYVKKTFLKFCSHLWVLKEELIRDERGQDLIEYALVVSLIALGATAAMSSLSTSFSTAFSKVGSKLATYTS